MNEDELLEDLIDIAFKVGSNRLFSDGDLLPMWLIVKPDDSRDIIGTPWNDEREKVGILTMIRLMLKTENAKAYSFVSEIWMAKLEPGEKRTWKAAEEAPHRKEGLMVVAATPEKQRMKSWEIKRNDKGRIIALEHIQEGLKNEGRMVNLFR